MALTVQHLVLSWPRMILGEYYDPSSPQPASELWAIMIVLSIWSLSIRIGSTGGVPLAPSLRVAESTIALAYKGGFVHA
jgi:hypothetical protein